MTLFEGFEAAHIDTEETTIFVRKRGEGPPLLLLHGFPETHLMWRDVAPQLAEHFTIICADLRGYGNSGCPPSSDDHAPYSKRTMAKDMVEVMAHFGFRRFSVAGHDRGGRVAYRLALDHPESVERVAVLDIVPGATRTPSSRSATGHGRCSRSHRSCPSNLCPRHLRRSSRTRSPNGDPLAARSRRKCATRTSTR